MDGNVWREHEILTRILIRLAGVALVAAFAGNAAVSDSAVAQTRCPEGRTASGACVNNGLARALRSRALIFSQPKLSYTGAPAAQSRRETQDTATPRSIETFYDKYGPLPPQPVPALN
jgi:hypothetical protein